MEVTWSVRPLNSDLSYLPVAKSQIRTVKSSPPVAAHLPSGEKSAQRTGSACPSQYADCFRFGHVSDAGRAVARCGQHRLAITGEYGAVHPGGVPCEIASDRRGEHRGNPVPENDRTVVTGSDQLVCADNFRDADVRKPFGVVRRAF